MNNLSWFFYPKIYEEKQALRALRKGSVLPSKHRVRSYHVYCNAQLIQSQNENFLLAKILDFQILTPLSQAGCLCKRPGGVKKKKKKLVPTGDGPEAGCRCRRHTCLSNCPASQPSNSRLVGEQEQFYLFPVLLFNGDFVKTVQLVTMVEL